MSDVAPSDHPPAVLDRPPSSAPFVAWWLALLPVSVAWVSFAGAYGADEALLPALIAGVIAIWSWRAAAGAAATVAASVALVVWSPDPLAVQFLLLTLGSGLVWGVAVGAVRSLRRPGLLPVRSLLGPALLPLSLANLLLLTGLGHTSALGGWTAEFVAERLETVPEELFVFPIELVLVAVFLAALTRVVPPVARRLAAWCRPLESVVRRAVTSGSSAVGAGDGDPGLGRDPEDEVGRFAAWWLALSPFFMAWIWFAGPYGVDRSLLPVIVTAVIWTAHRRPRAAWLVALLGALWMIHFGPVATLQFVGMVLVAGFLWGVATGAIRSTRWPGLLPVRRLLGPTVVVLAVVDLVVLSGLAQAPVLTGWTADFAATFLRTLPEDLYALPVGLVLVAAVLGALTRVAPRLAERLSRWTAPLERAARRHLVAPHAAFVRTCRRASARRRLGFGLPDLTHLPGVDPDQPTPAKAGFVTPLLVWLGTFVVVNLSRAVSPPPPDRAQHGWFDPGTMRWYLRNPRGVLTWVHWDSDQYLAIARHGYRYQEGVYARPDGGQEPAAWFPGYGLLIRWLTNLVTALFGQDVAQRLPLYELVAVAITVASGLAVSLLFWKWMSQRGMDGRARFLGLLCLLWFPYSFLLYGAAYSDPLFLALVLGAFVAFEADRPIVGGLVGAGACLVRVNGLALILGLAVLVATSPVVVARYREVLAARRSAGLFDRVRAGAVALRVRPALPIGVALAASGLGGFIVWCAIRYGEPLLYWHAHKALFGSLDPTSPEAVTKFDFFPSVYRRWSAQPGAMANLVAELAATLLVLGSLRSVTRTFGRAYTAYLGVVVAIIWFGSFDFIGAGRYLICAFPVAALAGGWLARHRVAAVVVPLMGATGVLVLTYHFCQTIDLGW